ncbi:MAG: polyprenol monophosphomannose synthase [Saprospiraceae bacterium]
MNQSLIIIPTYNEKENILDIIQAVLDQGKHFNVLVVDDNSPDGTAQLVESLPSFGKSVFILKRSGKYGLGTAYIAGFKYGLECGFDYIFEMDADFSHNPNDLPRLLTACLDGHDMSIGSRYVKGGNVENWPNDRLFLSKAASLYVRMVTGMPIMDPTAGFICYSRKVLDSLDLNKINFVGYTFQIAMKYYAFTKKFSIVEVPITFKDRTRGSSKMSSNIISEAIFGVLSMRKKQFMGYYNT